MNLPPCTLVTACYDMRPYNPNHARSVEDTMRGLEVLLHVPAYMIIHCDPFYAPLIQQRRAEIGYGAITRYEVASFEQLWAAKFVVQVKQNRAQYWPTRDQRTCAESHLLCCNKFDLVQQAIRTNPFSTPLFGWIDANLATAHAPNIKIAEQYTPNMVPWLLHRIPDRLFHIQVLNVEEKRFCDPEHWREYYAQYRWVVCGSFFVCGADVGMRVLDRLKDVMIQHTMSGYGHAEEMFYLPVLQEFRDEIVRSYGDYGQILNNFLRPTKNLHYVRHMILQRYWEQKCYRDCWEACQAVLGAMDHHWVPRDRELYLDVLDLAYRCALTTCDDIPVCSAEAIVQHVAKVAADDQETERVLRKLGSPLSHAQ